MHCNATLVGLCGTSKRSLCVSTLQRWRFLCHCVMLPAYIRIKSPVYVLFSKCTDEAPEALSEGCSSSQRVQSKLLPMIWLCSLDSCQSLLPCSSCSFDSNNGGFNVLFSAVFLCFIRACWPELLYVWHVLMDAWKPIKNEYKKSYLGEHLSIYWTACILILLMHNISFLHLGPGCYKHFIYKVI